MSHETYESLSLPRETASLSNVYMSSWKVINTVGLEPAYGFSHEPARSQTSQSLVYDLQEPFRRLCDVTVIAAFESGVLDLKDFYFMGDDYRYHLDVEAKKRFLNFKDRFNAGVKYKGKTWQWDTIILKKTQELARFLLVKTECLSFLEPSPSLERTGSIKLRRSNRSKNALVFLTQSKHFRH